MASKTVQERHTPPRAAIYVRVSSLQQSTDGTSLATQEAACRAYAIEQGYTVAEELVFSEVHTGSEMWERPQLTALRDAIRDGRVEAIVAHAVDRLSRSQTHVAILDDECERAGVALRFVTEEFAQTAVGRMIRGVKSFAAELEREKIRERTSRGKLARVKSGKLHGSARPIYGYRYTDDDRTRLMVAPEQAAVVRRIFALAEAGTPIIRICEQLNAEGIPAPRSVRQWARSTVAYLLAHQAYIGRAVAYRTAEARQDGKRRRVPRPEAEWVALPEGVIPPLIAPATFAAVRAQLARNQAQAARRSLDPQAYLLRAGYAICGVCGKTLVATGAGQRSGRVYPTYRAAQARHRECAPGGTGFSISATELDADIRAEVARRLLDPSIIERELLGRHDADPVADALALVDRSLEEARRKQANLAAALPLLDDEEARAPVVVALNDLAARLKSLRAEREGLQVQRHDWQLGREEVRTLAEWCRTAAENLAAFTYDDWRDALLALGVRVHIFPDGRTPRRWEIFTTADVAPVFVSSPT